MARLPCAAASASPTRERCITPSPTPVGTRPIIRSTPPLIPRRYRMSARQPVALSFTARSRRSDSAAIRLLPQLYGPAGPNNFQGQDTTYTAVGNVMGWNPANRDLANLTGIIPPKGVRDPYVYNYYLGVQHQIARSLVFEVNYVGTIAHKLFRAEQVNRVPGGSSGSDDGLQPAVPAGCTIDRFGRELCSQKDAAGITNTTGRLNPNYGRLRVWENVNNSVYNSCRLR